jgi:hypothetical protein
MVILFLTFLRSQKQGNKGKNRQVGLHQSKKASTGGNNQE